MMKIDCYVCRGTPVLRVVGMRGYCKKHEAEAFADRKAYQDNAAALGKHIGRRHSKDNRADRAFRAVMNKSRGFA